METNQNFRYCVINSSGSKLKVKLTANNALRAGAVFGLFEQDENNSWKNIKEWRISAGDSGEGIFDIDFDINDLSKKALTWKINVLSMIPSVTNGIVEIQVIQDGVSCSVTKPMQWELNSIPSFDSNEVPSIKSSLIFLIR
jgi:hypothetical protein